MSINPYPAGTINTEAKGERTIPTEAFSSGFHLAAEAQVGVRKNGILRTRAIFFLLILIQDDSWLGGFGRSWMGFATVQALESCGGQKKMWNQGGRVATNHQFLTKKKTSKISECQEQNGAFLGFVYLLISIF